VATGCSFGATIGLVVSEHPNSTNAILATSKRTHDKVFITLSFSEVVRNLIEALIWDGSRGEKTKEKQKALPPQWFPLQAMRKIGETVINRQRGLNQKVVGVGSEAEELERGPERRPSGCEPPSIPNCGGILLCCDEKVNHANA
jgi:hypothetical protein